MRANGRKRVMLSDYEAVGGVQGVLSGYIERALRQHPAAQRELARQV